MQLTPSSGFSITETQNACWPRWPSAPPIVAPPSGDRLANGRGFRQAGCGFASSGFLNCGQASSSLRLDRCSFLKPWLDVAQLLGDEVDASLSGRGWKVSAVVGRWASIVGGTFFSTAARSNWSTPC
jgi:hypothetical protein